MPGGPEALDELSSFVLFLLLVIGFVLFAIWPNRDRPPSPKTREPADRSPPTSPQSPKTTGPGRETARPGQDVAGQVLLGPAYVVDGDSLIIKKTEIRLFGVDAPEMNHPYGRKAKSALLSLCKGQRVRAELIENDAHDRTVAKCYLPDGRDLSAEMVKMGLAIDWPKYSEGRYRELEVPDARKKMWLAAARQRGHMHVWAKFDAQQAARVKKGKR